MPIPWLVSLRLYGPDRASVEAEARRLAARVGLTLVRVQSEASAEISQEELEAVRRGRRMILDPDEEG